MMREWHSANRMSKLGIRQKASEDEDESERGAGKLLWLASFQILEHLPKGDEQSGHAALHRRPQQAIIDRVVAVAHPVTHPGDAAPVHRRIPRGKFRR